MLCSPSVDNPALVKVFLIVSRPQRNVAGRSMTAQVSRRSMTAQVSRSKCTFSIFLTRKFDGPKIPFLLSKGMYRKTKIFNNFLWKKKKSSIRPLKVTYVWFFQKPQWPWVRNFIDIVYLSFTRFCCILIATLTGLLTSGIVFQLGNPQVNRVNLRVSLQPIPCCHVIFIYVNYGHDKHIRILINSRYT